LHQILAKRLFLFLERLRREPVARALVELEGNQRLERGRLRELQQAKLQRLLDGARASNRYYRPRLEGVRSPADLQRIPLLTKAELRANHRAIISDGFERSAELCKTSGSTGEPLKFYRDRETFAYTLASVFRAHRWHGIEIGAREAMLWGIPSAPLDRARIRLRDSVLNRFREKEYDLSPAVLDAFFQRVGRSRAEYVFGYSSMVYEFALFVRERRLDGRGLALRAAICTAESISDEQRTVIEQELGCPVVSEYGSAETGIISYQCRFGGHHVSDDCVLLELLDADGRPVSDGEVGRVIVTVLHSQCAPIIRYELGDYAVRRAGACECGISLSMLERVIGRTAGVIVTPSGRCFHSIALYYVMKDFAGKHGGVRQFRVVQSAVDALDFHVVASEEFSPEAQEALRALIDQRLGSGMKITFTRHERLPRSRSGKLTDFESRIDADTALVKSFRSPEFR
jgi:phenylacetate-CoA ligase